MSDKILPEVSFPKDALLHYYKSFYKTLQSKLFYSSDLFCRLRKQPMVVLALLNGLETLLDIFYRQSSIETNRTNT
ncbi:hypothetical protein D0T57_06275 [Dysgonomonas sp. 511]|nr:hypothetical protein [Dysgonomonas sp. 511]